MLKLVKQVAFFTGVAVLFCLVAEMRGNAQEAKSVTGKLTTTKGTEITYTIQGRTVRATVEVNGASRPLANGDYGLTNGGAIKVKNGVIIWDAFGALRRLKANGIAAGGDLIG